MNEYLFVHLIIGSLGLFSYSFIRIKAHDFLKVVLIISMCLAEMLGIPNLAWPLGSEWWDPISLGFGRMSLTIITFNLMVFGLIHARKALIVKKDTSQA